MANKLVSKECPMCGKKKRFKGDICPKCRDNIDCQFWCRGGLCANIDVKTPFCDDPGKCKKKKPKSKPESTSESKPKSNSNPVYKTSVTIHTDGKLTFSNPTGVEMQVTKGFLFKRKRGDTEGMRIRYRRRYSRPVMDGTVIVKYIKVWGRWYPYPRKNIVKLN